MLSRVCMQRNKTIIPSLLGQHAAVLTGDAAVIDLSTAENWSVKNSLVSSLTEELRNLTEEDLAYASGIGGCLETRSLLGELLTLRFHPAQRLDASHVVLAAGGSFALTALVEQICDPGDGILIAAPYWAGLDIAVSIHCHAQIVPIHVPLDVFFSATSVQYYADALQTSAVPVRAVLLCNPHNPLGQCYPRDTLDAMLQFCARHGLHYISDEVYALSAHQPEYSVARPFVSALRLTATKTAPVHVIYSLSKDFGCNGLRLGALINQSDQALRLSAALSVHSQVSTVSTALAKRAVLAPAAVGPILASSREKLTQAYRIVRDFLEASQFVFIPAQYGMFVFARLLKTDKAAEEGSLQGCFKAQGVSVSTGSSYHFQQPGWFRICYGMPTESLLEGLHRISEGVLAYQSM